MTVHKSYDISADVFQWFNQHCNDVLDADDNGSFDELEANLTDADIGMFADEAIDVLTTEYGWPLDVIESYRDQIEYDIEKLIKEALNYIEYGIRPSSNNADWIDRYSDNDAYSLSLESRVRRLEALAARKSVKNESLVSFDGIRPGMRVQNEDGEVGVVKDVDTIANLRRFNHSGMSDRGGMSKEIVNWEEVDDYCRYTGSSRDIALLVKMDYGYVICCDPEYMSLA